MNSIILSILSGLSIGILGSFHCLGMCGPLALALPIHHLNSFNKTKAIFSYNLGRAFSYTTIGILFGLLGKTFSMFKMQQVLTIGAGIILLIIISGLHFGKLHIPIINQISNFIHQKLKHILSTKFSIFQFLGLGIANGFLPCGLVYVAVLAGLATGSVWNSAGLMFGFGLGTLPMMALTMYFGKFISVSMRTTFNKASPYIMTGIAILLILRGLNLGIPYVSPKLGAEKVSCCHK